MVAEFADRLAAAQRGDRAAIESLWQDLHPRLLRFLYGLDPRDAEDLESETWLRVAAGLPTFAGDERAFRAWVFTIARHRWVDSRRRRRVGEPVPAERLTEVPAADDPAQETEDAMSLAAAVELVAALPSDQAEVILLRVVAGLDVGEVAAIVGRRPGTVRVLQHRGLRRLAQRVEARRSIELEEKKL